MTLGNGMGGWDTALMVIDNLVFWGLLIAGIVLLVSFTGRSAQAGPTGQPATPRQVLAERLARGEIDEDEYARRLKALSSGPTRPPGG